MSNPESRINLSSSPIYTFDDFTLDVSRARLLHAGQTVRLRPKSFEVLTYLVENRGRVIPKDELIRAAWPDSFVTDDSLVQCLRDIRRAFGADRQYIKTVPRRGYIFDPEEQTGPVQQEAFPAPPYEGSVVGHTDNAILGRRQKSALAIAAGVLMILLAGVISYRFTHNEPASKTYVLRRLTAYPGLTTDPALSPDGKVIAYASDRGGEGNLNIWAQYLAGGEAVRLTWGEEDEREPAFSPDGMKIVYRSERDGGGIYLISALGGEARKIAPRGFRPRFAPDGAQVVYWTGSAGGDTSASGSARVYVAPAAGGTPREIAPGFAAARYPVWAPDGRSILFLGARDASAPLEETLDWWVAPLSGGPVKKTGAANMLRNLNLSEPIPAAWIREDHSVIFSARSGDSVNLWQVSLAPAALSPSGRPRRLTFGAGIEIEPAVAGNENSRQIVFTSLVANPDIWSLPLAINQAEAPGALQCLTQNIAADIQPSVSVDGRKVVFTSSRSGASQVWIKDVAGGAETQLTFSSTPKDWPIISADGSQVAYSLYGSQTVCLVSASGGEEKKLCDSCGPVKSWSSDGRRILFHSGSNRPLRTIGLFDLPTGLSRDLIKHSRYSLYQPQFSPDDRWVAFHAKVSPNRTQLFILPLRENVAPAENDWIAVTAGSDDDQDPQWSQDGRMLYFFSERDGFRCIWAQRLDAETKRPLGAPFAVYHFHSARRSLMNVGLSSLELTLARDKIVFPLGELTGAIWMADERREY